MGSTHRQTACRQSLQRGFSRVYQGVPFEKQGSLQNPMKGGDSIGKKGYVKRSVSFTKENMEELDRIAIKLSIPTSELIRRYVDRGMTLDKTKDDFDFIRRQIREEIKPILESHAEGIRAMITKIGIPALSMCEFTGDILLTYAPIKEQKTRKELFNKARDNALIYFKANEPDQDLKNTN